MRRFNQALGLAAVVVALAPSFADAQVISTDNSTFPGVTFSYAGVSTQFNLDTFTDTAGNTLSAGGSNLFSIFNGFGLLTQDPFPYTFTWTLGSPVTQFGIDFANVSYPGTVTSAVFSNGDSWSGSQSIGGGSFVGWTTTTPFNSVAVTLTASGTIVLLDYRAGTATAAIPEASSQVSGGILLASAAAMAAFRRRRKVAAASAA